MINMSEEYCPFCDDYFSVDADKCEPCPGGCGNDLAPCNACLCGEDGCYCDWAEGKQGCRRFPPKNDCKLEIETSEQRQIRLECNVGRGINNWRCEVDCAFWNGERCTDNDLESEDAENERY